MIKHINNITIPIGMYERFCMYCGQKFDTNFKTVTYCGMCDKKGIIPGTLSQKRVG